MTTIVRVRRAVKVSTGNYENTDISIELEETCSSEGLDFTVNALTNYAKNYLREQIDEIELGKRKVVSKASRFGL